MTITESSLERNLTLLREQGLRAVELHSVDAYRKVLLSHVDLVEMYLKVASKFRKATGRPRITGPAFLGYESNVLYKISASIDELVRKAIESRDGRIIAAMAYGLTQAMAKALDSGAFSVFVKLLDPTKVSFFLAMNIQEPSSRTRVIETLASAIENFGSFSLVWTRLSEAAERPESLHSYAKALIGSLSGMLKLAIDRAEIEVFSIGLNTLQAMIPERPGDRASELYMIDLRLEGDGLSRHQRSELENEARRLREEIEFFKAVDEARRDLIYNLGSWATKRFTEKKLEPERAQAVMSKVFPYFGDFAELTKLYLNHLAQDRDDYGWGLWEAEPGAFQPSQSWMTQFYVLASARILMGIPNERERDQIYRTIEERTIPSSSLELARDEINKIGSSFSDEAPYWEILVPGLGERQTSFQDLDANQAGSLGSLNFFWDELVSRRQRDEERKLLDAEIVESTRTDFANELKKSWTEYSTFRKLAKVYGFFEDHTRDTEVPANIHPWGPYPRLEDKMWFVAEHPFASRSIAENLGRGLGELETKYIFDAIASVLEPVSAIEPNQAKTALDTFIDSIPGERLDSYVLLSLRGFDFTAKLYESDQFQPLSFPQANDVSNLNIRAKYRSIPFIEIWGMGPGIDSCGMCVPIRGMGIWRQYWASIFGEELAIELNSINDVKAEELLRQNPRLVRDRAGQPHNHVEAVTHLRKKVLLRIWERFSYEPSKGMLAIRIILPPTK